MKIPFLTEYIYYFKALYRFVGWPLVGFLLISCIVAATDAIGLSMLLPLMEASNLGESNTDTSIYTKVFDFFGVEQSFGAVLVLMGAVFLLKGIFKLSESLVNAHIVSFLFTHWRKRLLDLYKRLNYEYYTSKNTGHFTNVLNAQTQTGSVFVTDFSAFTSRATTAIAYLTLACLINIRFTVMAIGAVIVSAVSWFSMLQVNMATMQSEIDKLNVIILSQEDKVQACLEVVDDYYELKRRFNNQ